MIHTDTQFSFYQQLAILEADIRHTAEDLDEKQIDKFFDIELNAEKNTNGVSNGKKTKLGEESHVNVGYVSTDEKNGKPTTTHM